MASIQRIGVVGAGTMGSGIAQLAAQTGHDVRLYDVSDEILDGALARIHGFWQRGVDKGRLTPEDMQAATERLKTTRKLDDFFDVDLVIEAVVEDLELKHQVFDELDRCCTPGALLATNTSSLSVTTIAEKTKYPARVGGMHFFNPAPLMALVEVVRGKPTSTATKNALVEVSRVLGKTPVVAADTPGFIVNRIARPFYVEPLRILSEGGANPATIDAIMEKAGFKMGPFALMDLVGIDVNYAVSSSVFKATGLDRFEPHSIQKNMVESGKLGRKTGEGFYAYGQGKREYTVTSGMPIFSEDSQDLSGLLRFGTDLPGPQAASKYIHQFARHTDLSQRILPRMICSLVNEAAQALGEGVASREDIDTAMCLGLNWPQGPLKWAEQIGLEEVASVLDILRISTSQERYRAAPLLLTLVRQGNREFTKK